MLTSIQATITCDVCNKEIRLLISPLLKTKQTLAEEIDELLCDTNDENYNNCWFTGKEHLCPKCADDHMKELIQRFHLGT